MKFSAKFILIGLSFSLFSGCSTLDKWLAEKQQRRVFQVRNTWVTPATANDNLGFRKINRFTPQFFSSKKVGDILIQGNAVDGISAYEKDSHRQIWRLMIPNGVEGSSTVKGPYLYFGGNDGQFYCVEAESGHVVWTFPTRIENLSEPLVEDGLVYFLTGSNSLYALEADSGKQAWLYTRPDPSSLSIRGGSKPAFKAGSLYVGFSDGAVVSLAAKTGQVKWEKQLNRNKKFRDLDTNPLVDGDFVYVLGFDDATYALRTATGELAWKLDKGGYGGILMTGDRLYFGGTNDELVCADKNTGRVIWTKSIAAGIATQPQLLKGILVYGESQGLLRFAEASSGREVGHFEPGRGILSQPAVDEKRNLVYFISGEANLYAIEAKWGHPSLLPHLR